MKKKVSIRDVAKEAGVSVGTVSRVCNHSNVSEEYAVKVRAAMAKLEYRPSRKILAAEENRSRNVVILADRELNEREAWTQQIIYGIVCSLSRYQYTSTVEFLAPDTVYALPASLKNADGCVVWGEFTPAFYRTLKQTMRSIPVVSYSREIPYENSVAVMGTPYESMRKAVEYLLACGHQNIGYVTWEAPDTLRHKAFEAMLKEYGRDVDQSLIYDVKAHGLWQRNGGSETGFQATIELFKAAKEPPTAVIYENDSYARGGLEAIKSLGFRIPEDVSVIGFDDLVGSQETFPPLTCMKLDAFKVGMTIAETLDKLWMNKPHEKVVYLARELVKRKSAGIAPAVQKAVRKELL